MCRTTPPPGTWFPGSAGNFRCPGGDIWSRRKSCPSGWSRFLRPLRSFCICRYLLIAGNRDLFGFPRAFLCISGCSPVAGRHHSFLFVPGRTGWRGRGRMCGCIGRNRRFRRWHLVVLTHMWRGPGRSLPCFRSWVLPIVKFIRSSLAHVSLRQSRVDGGWCSVG